MATTTSTGGTGGGGGGEVISRGKSIFVLAVVLGCFAILWPRIFYPMITASLRTDTEPEPLCCEVMNEKDINLSRIMNQLCLDILNRTKAPDPTGKPKPKTKGFISPSMKCRNEILDVCGLDVFPLLKDDPISRVQNKEYKDSVIQLRSFNVSQCLKNEFGADLTNIGLPRRYKQPDSSPSHFRPERPIHHFHSQRSEKMHPSLRDKGTVIPRPQRTIEKEARPGPMPGVRPPVGGAGHVPQTSPKGASSMGLIMPVYTVGIIIFFIYTIFKVLFRKSDDLDKKDPYFSTSTSTSKPIKPVHVPCPLDKSQPQPTRISESSIKQPSNKRESSPLADDYGLRKRFGQGQDGQNLTHQTAALPKPQCYEEKPILVDEIQSRMESENEVTQLADFINSQDHGLSLSQNITESKLDNKLEEPRLSYANEIDNTLHIDNKTNDGVQQVAFDSHSKLDETPFELEESDLELLKPLSTLSVYETDADVKDESGDAELENLRKKLAETEALLLQMSEKLTPNFHLAHKDPSNTTSNKENIGKVNAAGSSKKEVTIKLPDEDLKKSNKDQVLTSKSLDDPSDSYTTFTYDTISPTSTPPEFIEEYVYDIIQEILLKLLKTNTGHRELLSQIYLHNENSEFDLTKKEKQLSVIGFESSVSLENGEPWRDSSPVPTYVPSRPRTFSPPIVSSDDVPSIYLEGSSLSGAGQLIVSETSQFEELEDNCGVDCMNVVDEYDNMYDDEDISGPPVVLSGKVTLSVISDLPSGSGAGHLDTTEATSISTEENDWAKASPARYSNIDQSSDDEVEDISGVLLNDSKKEKAKRSKRENIEGNNGERSMNEDLTQFVTATDEDPDSAQGGLEETSQDISALDVLQDDLPDNDLYDDYDEELELENSDNSDDGDYEYEDDDDDYEENRNDVNDQAVPNNSNEGKKP